MNLRDLNHTNLINYGVQKFVTYKIGKVYKINLISPIAISTDILKAFFFVESDGLYTLFSSTNTCKITVEEHEFSDCWIVDFYVGEKHIACKLLKHVNELQNHCYIIVNVVLELNSRQITKLINKSNEENE